MFKLKVAMIGGFLVLLYGGVSKLAGLADNSMTAPVILAGAFVSVAAALLLLIVRQQIDTKEFNDRWNRKP